MLKAKPLSWVQVKAALPSPDRCANISALDLAEHGMYDFLANPERIIAEVKLLKQRPRPGCIRTAPGQWPVLARGLLEYGVFTALTSDKLIQLPGGPLVNGAFGVEKPEMVGGDDPEVSSLAVLRLIMNLTASNSGQSSFEGDIPLLPFLYTRRVDCAWTKATRRCCQLTIS